MDDDEFVIAVQFPGSPGQLSQRNFSSRVLHGAPGLNFAGLPHVKHRNMVRLLFQ